MRFPALAFVSGRGVAAAREISSIPAREMMTWCFFIVGNLSMVFFRRRCGSDYLGSGF